uniref:RAB14, member RAS onco family n=2 Tax=Equus TaxID=9789 RepID=A0A9L0RR00_HORSE
RAGPRPLSSGLRQLRAHPPPPSFVVRPIARVTGNPVQGAPPSWTCPRKILREPPEQAPPPPPPPPPLLPPARPHLLGPPAPCRGLGRPPGPFSRCARTPLPRPDAPLPPGKLPSHQQPPRRSTYNHLSSWLTDARNLTNPNTVIILIGNKADLEAQRDVTYEEAKQFAEENGLLFLEASAKTGENVEDAFLEAAKKIYQNIQDGSLDLNAAESGVQHKPSAPQGGRLTSEPQPQREGCGC